MKYNYQIGSGSKIPYQHGELAHAWYRDITQFTHASFIVDPRGTGTYCHITMKYPTSNTKYHYGYEVQNELHRNRGKHYWTTPYHDDYKFTREIKKYLKNLFNIFCQDAEISIPQSLLPSMPSMASIPPISMPPRSKTYRYHPYSRHYNTKRGTGTS